MLKFVFHYYALQTFNQLFFKLKGILSQSQDKALRRIGELREVSFNALKIVIVSYIYHHCI